MVIKHGGETPAKEITDESTYLNRRAFLRGGLFVGAVAATAGVYYSLTGGARRTVSAANLETLTTGPAVSETMAASSADEERIASGFITKEPKRTATREVELKAGWNVLVFKSCHRTWQWQQALNLTELDGAAAQGLTYRDSAP